MDNTEKIHLLGDGNGRPSNYEPLVLSDHSVYELAMIGATQEEIADLFNVTRGALVEHHGAAFSAGKAAMKLKPRKIVYKNLDLLQKKFEEHLELVGEFSINAEGKEIRIPVDVALASAVLQYAKQANCYLPKELLVQVSKNPYTELSDEELISRISQLKETK